MQDDFYLNVVDWSPNNVLAVALSNSLYLWSAETGDVRHLCNSSELISSVSWASNGSHLALGTTAGKVLLYDTQRENAVRILPGH